MRKIIGRLWGWLKRLDKNQSKIEVHSIFLYQDMPEVTYKYVGEARLVDLSRNYDKCFTISSNNLPRMLDKMGNIITEQVCS